MNYWQTGFVPPDAEQTLFLAAWASGGTLPRACAQRYGKSVDLSKFTGFPDDLLRELSAAAVAEAVEEEAMSPPSACRVRSPMTS